MIQYIIVFAVLAVAVVYAGYMVWRQFRGARSSECTGYCDGCPFAGQGGKRAKNCHDGNRTTVKSQHKDAQNGH